MDKIYSVVKQKYYISYPGFSVHNMLTMFTRGFLGSCSTVTLLFFKHQAKRILNVKRYNIHVKPMFDIIMVFL